MSNEEAARSLLRRLSRERFDAVVYLDSRDRQLVVTAARTGWCQVEHDVSRVRDVEEA